MSTRKNLSQKATQKNTTETKTSLKNFQLRAFTITQQNQPVTKLQQSIVQLMQKRLQSEKISAESRTMLLNQDDPDKISDSFPYYEIRDNTILGTIMRISNSEKVQHVPVDLMKKEKFSVSEITSSEIKDNKIYRSHYYFAINDEFLVTNLPLTITISRFQAYINWFLKDVQYEFSPLIDKAPDLKFSDLRKITISDPTNIKKDEVKSKWINLKKLKDTIIKSLLRDTKDLDDIEMGRIISAQLLLKFIKPKDMSEEDYKKAMGIYLKPISDLNNVVFTEKNNRKFSADKLMKTKMISVEKTESGFISEPQLFDEMNIFLASLA